MELCERTLEDYITSQNHLHFSHADSATLPLLSKDEFKERLRIAYEIMQGLLSVHAKHGLIHRDLTPRNIFFCKNGTVKIGDFRIIAYKITLLDPSCAFALRAVSS